MQRKERSLVWLKRYGAYIWVDQERIEKCAKAIGRWPTVEDIEKFEGKSIHSEG